MLPPKPSEFQALFVTPSDTFCLAIVNLMKLSVLWYRMAKWFFQLADSTEPSTEFEAFVCNIYRTNCVPVVTADTSTTTT